jgi:two-component system sensor histidine kinase HydH
MRNAVSRQKRLYLPAITIIALALTLTVIVAISSYRNLNREGKRVSDHLLREGKTLLDLFEDRALSEILLALLSGDQWDVYLQRLAENMARKPNIAYILIADADNRAIVHSDRNRIGKMVDPSLASEGRMVESDGEDKVFEVGVPFRYVKDEFYDGLSDDQRRLMSENSINAALEKHWALIGMDMKGFESARTEDISHTVMMGIMLLIIGSASLYFIVVVQNYYLVNRTLNTMRNYTQNVVESMVNGLISVDESGAITTINQTASEIIGIGASDAEGRDISEIIKSDECDIQEVMVTDRSVVEREINFERSGESIPLSVSVSTLKNEAGKVMGAVVVIRDLREIKELQEKVRRAERLASLGRLAAGIAHEIRNPLSSIRGFAKYFQGRLDPKTRDVRYAEAMVDEIDRLNRIIEALLDFARPAEPKLQLHSVADILDHTLQLMQADIDAESVKVVRNIQDGIPDVMVDRDQIIQAILNILLNAVEAMNKGGQITLSVSAESDNLRIDISDTGPGIPEEDMAKVFDPFFTTREKGTGLGLAIVHKIVENHNGEIRMDSIVGKATTFTILLPLVKEVNQVFGKSLSKKERGVDA